jgi:hypothetical protein
MNISTNNNIHCFIQPISKQFNQFEENLNMSQQSESHRNSFNYPEKEGKNRCVKNLFSSEIEQNQNAIYTYEHDFETEDSKEKQIEQLKKEKMELIIENNKLQMLYNELLNQNSTNKNKAIQYDRIVNRQTLLKNRIMFCISFLQTCGPYSCIYGSMIRKIFELFFHLNQFEANDTKAECLNSDINVLFNCHNSPDKIKVASEFYNLMHSLEVSRITSEKVNSGVDTPTFANYKLTGINTSTSFVSNGECIPRAKLFFIHNTDSICIDIIAWRYKEIVDLSINSYVLNYNGIQPLLEYNFLNYLENIYFEETKYLFRPDLLQNLAYPPNTSLPRNEKLIHLSKMYDLISNRLLKVLPSNYKIIKYNPIKIEYKEDCTITGCKAPYPIVNLTCGHTLSIMAYKGILFKTNDIDTQSLRCPLCREDLKIKFDDSNIAHTTKYNLLSASDCIKMTKDLNIITNVSNSKFISKDAIEHL